MVGTRLESSSSGATNNVCIGRSRTHARLSFLLCIYIKSRWRKAQIRWNHNGSHGNVTAGECRQGGPGETMTSRRVGMGRQRSALNLGSVAVPPRVAMETINPACDLVTFCRAALIQSQPLFSRCHFARCRGSSANGRWIFASLPLGTHKTHTKKPSFSFFVDFQALQFLVFCLLLEPKLEISSVLELLQQLLDLHMCRITKRFAVEVPPKNQKFFSPLKMDFCQLCETWYRGVKFNLKCQNRLSNN